MVDSPFTSDEYNYQNAFQNLVCNVKGIVSPLALGIQCLHENEKPQSVLGVVFS